MYNAVGANIWSLGWLRYGASGRGRIEHRQEDAYGRGISRHAPGTVGKVHGSGTQGAGAASERATRPGAPRRVAGGAGPDSRGGSAPGPGRSGGTSEWR